MAAEEGFVEAFLEDIEAEVPTVEGDQGMGSTGGGDAGASV